MRVVLNIDAGELPDEPEALFALAHVVNIACGGHAGDEASMDRALALCRRFGTRPGAHPSYADREGFGRRALPVASDDLARTVEGQLAALSERAGRVPLTVAWVKPHGALYHAADQDDALAVAVARATEAVLGRDVTLVGPAGHALERAARALGLAFAREGFADRATLPGGGLVPRGEPGALITDPELARARARELARSGRVDTICIHADTPGAVAVARAVREELDAG